MKIAICFYGQPRLYNNGYIIINNFIKKNLEHNFDFFFHTWYDDKQIGSYYEASPWRNISKEELLIKENTIEDLINLYNPKKYNYESPIIFNNDILNEIKSSIMFNESPNYIKNNIYCTLSNIYSKYKVSILLEEYINETKINYDLVISCRFDILIDMNINISNININKINCIDQYTRCIISDHLIITNYKLFNEYSKSFINLNKFINNEKILYKLNEIGAGCNFTVETLVTSNMLLYYENIYDIIYMNKEIKGFI